MSSATERRSDDAAETMEAKAEARPAPSSHRRSILASLSRSDYIFAGVLLCLCLALWAPRLRGPIDLRYDGAVYYILGTSIAEGKGYRLLNEPGEIKAVQYPPMLPAIVAVHQWVLGTSDPDVVGRWLRITSFLFFMLYAPAVYAMARVFLPAGQSFLVALITLLYFQTIFLSDLLFAEIPFALVTALFVLCNLRSDRPGWFAATALLGVIAFLFRTAGIALLGAWVAQSLLRRQWRQAALRTAVALVPVLAWQGYIISVTTSDHYNNPVYPYQRASYQYYNVSYAENIRLIDPFIPELGEATPRDLARRVAVNLYNMPGSLGEAVSSQANIWRRMLQRTQQVMGIAWFDHSTAMVMPRILGLFVLGGTVVFLARRQWFVGIYIVASVGLIALTPWPLQFSRYLAPLTPFLVLALVQGLMAGRDFLGRWPGWRARLGSGAALAVLAVIFAGQLFSVLHLFRWHADVTPTRGTADAGRLFYYHVHWAKFDAALAWLTTHAAADDVIASAAPHWVYLKTDRKSVMVPMVDDPVEAQRLMDSVPVRYVVIDEHDWLDVSGRYALPAVQAHPEQWREVHVVPESQTRVFERIFPGEL